MSAWAEKAVNHPSGFAVELNIVNDLVAVVFGLRTWVYGRDGDGAAAYAQKGVLDSFLFIAELLVIYHMKKRASSAFSVYGTGGYKPQGRGR